MSIIIIIDYNISACYRYKTLICSYIIIDIFCTCLFLIGIFCVNFFCIPRAQYKLSKIQAGKATAIKKCIAVREKLTSLSIIGTHLGLLKSPQCYHIEFLIGPPLYLTRRWFFAWSLFRSKSEALISNKAPE